MKNSTQISHAIFQQEDLDAAVLTYRERVREDDTPELKALLRKQALDAHCPLTHENLERATAVLSQLILADTESMFEPQPETDPESLQLDVLSVLSEDAGDSGVGDGWTSEGIAYRLGVEHEVVIATLSSLIDAGKASSYKPKDVDVDLYRLPDLKEQLKGLPDEPPDPAPDDAIPDPEDAEPSEPGTEHSLQSVPEPEPESETDETDDVQSAIIGVLSQGGNLNINEIEQRLEWNYPKKVLLKGLKNLTDADKVLTARIGTGVYVYRLIETETETSESITADMIQKVCDCVNESSAGISARAISDHSGLQISIVMVCLEELIINSEVNLMGESTYVPYSKDGVDADLIKRIDSVVDDVALILGEMGVALSVMDIAQRLNTNSAVIAHALRKLIANPVLVEKGIITTSEFNHYLFCPEPSEPGTEQPLQSIPETDASELSETEDDVKANLKALVLDMLSNGAMTVESLSLKADIIEESIRWALKQLALDGKVETTDGETYSLCVALETSEPESEYPLTQNALDEMKKQHSERSLDLLNLMPTVSKLFEIGETWSVNGVANEVGIDFVKAKHVIEALIEDDIVERVPLEYSEGNENLYRLKLEG